MTIDTQEKQFEDHIENVLLKGGYQKRTSERFDRRLTLDKELFIQFLKETQLESYKTLEKIYGLELEHEILRKLRDTLEDKGIMSVLRNGFQIANINLNCVYFKPVSKRNPDVEAKY